jgi:hypothetical protein
VPGTAADPSSSSSSSSSPSGEAAPPKREAPDNPQPSTKNPQPSPTGRPPFDQRAIVIQICTIIAADGLSDSAAARRVGIGTSTIGRWKNENPDIAEQFAMSRETFRAHRLAIIRGAKHKDGTPNWRAAAWELERVFPEDYARRPGLRMEHHETHLPPLEELRAFLRAAEETGASYERLIAQHAQLMRTAEHSAADERKRTEQALTALHQMYEQARLYALASHEPEPEKPALLVNYTPPPPEPDYARFARESAEYCERIGRKWEESNKAEAARMARNAAEASQVTSAVYPTSTRPADPRKNPSNPSHNSQNPVAPLPKNPAFPSHNSRNPQPRPIADNPIPPHYSHISPDDDHPDSTYDGIPGLHA